MVRSWVFVLFIIQSFSVSAVAEFEPLGQALRRFHDNPRAFLSEPLTKIRGRATVGPRLTGQPDPVKQKIDQRCQCLKSFKQFLLGHAVQPMTGWDDHNRPADLLGTDDFVKRLDEMERLGYEKAFLPETPWAGDYFAIAKGVLGSRAFDKDFYVLRDWKARYDYITAHPFAEIFNQGNDADREVLAISEKYDLLMGDSSGSLTSYMWHEGQAYFDKDKKVEEWMGICHGWAPASYMVPRPLHSIEVTAYDGAKKLKIFPAELKGLISQQWAVNPVQVRFIGQRCTSKKPASDANGRITEEGCFDVNPATWHLATVNRIAKQGKSFVFDATFDYEVWNQPLFGYQYHYFNPQTLLPVNTLAEATVEREAFTGDKFSTYRDSRTRRIVGVAMTVGYVVESLVNRYETDTPDFDTVTWARYIYDLELDENGDVIGGEWYTNKHPDFMWTPRDDETARSPIDKYIDMIGWSTDASAPLEWRRAAQVASPHGLILGPLVDRLVERARQ